jgi:hypothetical protein
LRGFLFSNHRHARGDQEPNNGGRLSRQYCDATQKFLGDNGLDPDDVSTVMEVLNRYRDEAEDQAANERHGLLPGPVHGGTGWRGDPAPGGAQDRYAYDSYGNRRPRVVFSQRENDAFAKRFPELAHIRVLG